MFVSSLSLSDISLDYFADEAVLFSSAFDSSTVSIPHSFSEGAFSFSKAAFACFLHSSSLSRTLNSGDNAYFSAYRFKH
jgi:hypothetical protein